MPTIEEVVSHEEFLKWLNEQPSDRIINDFPNVPFSYWLEELFQREVQIKLYMITVEDAEDGDFEFTTPDWMDSYMEAFFTSEAETAGEWKQYLTNMDEPWNLFVYGTLKRGHGNNYLMTDGEYIKTARINGYTLTGVGIPFAVKAPGRHIIGELWRVPKYQVLGPIDSLEGHPHWYTRTWTEQLGGTWFYLCQSSANGMVGGGYAEWPDKQYSQYMRRYTKRTRRDHGKKKNSAATE